ncbi:MAG: NAD(P)-dependent oxidoreductase [Dehalococcoidia bacterium]|nr:NAD(P)-dependent oxidoreductase [Dehalococcoidia bacterium]
MADERTGFWRDRVCLVTGGLGCGGSHLSEQLLNRGATVYVLDRVYPRNSYLVLTGLIQKVGYIQGDVRDLELVKFLLERYQIDTVFHLAAQPIVPVSNSMPYETLSINVMGTYAVLEAVRTSTFAKNLVFASSGAYYGMVSQRDPIPEEQSPNVAGNIYAPSKVAADIAVRCYAQTYGMKAAVCRFINTYGPGNTNFSTIVPTALTNLIEGMPYDFGNRDDGSSSFDYLHIRDMIRGYLAVAENIDRFSGEAFNFGGGKPISVKDLAQLISRLYDGQEREPLFHGSRKEKQVYKWLDTTKARTALGWQPSMTLEDGLSETIDWYKRFWSRLH